MKNRKGIPLMLAGLLLIVAALLLVLYNTWESSTAGDASEDALLALESIRFDRKLESPAATETPEPILTEAPTQSITEPVPTADKMAIPEGSETAAPVSAATQTPVEGTMEATPVPTATQAPMDAAATNTPVPTATAPADETATLTPDMTPTAVPTATATPVPTASPTPVPTAAPVPTEDATPTPTVTPTAAATPTEIPLITPEPLPIWERVPGYEMPVVEINGMDYVGTLTIPALELKLPVQQTWSYKLLKTSPCVFHGTCYEDGFVVIAHRYNTHFSGLKDLRPGDTAIFTDMDGNVFRYEVVTTDTLKPNQLKELLDDQYAMSLMTCTYDGSKRVTVRFQRK